MYEIAKRKEFGDWIREKRYKVDLSLWEASMELGYKSRGTLANMECGRGALPLERIFDLAELYNIDLDELLNKLGECEPDLYGKFMALRARFLKHLTRDLTHSLEMSAGGKVMSLHNTTLSDTGSHYQAKHHKPFLNENGYIEVDFGLHHYILSDIEELIRKILQEAQPEILFPGLYPSPDPLLTNIDIMMPQIAGLPVSCAN